MYNSENYSNELSLLPEESLFRQKMFENNTEEKYSDYLNQIMTDDCFLPAFLSKNIGKWMKVEAVLGNKTETKIGQLIKVGAGYILLKQNTNPVSSILCNLNCVRFVTILYSGKIKE